MTRKPRATYDREADAIGVYFAPDGAGYVESEEVAPGLTLDYDADGHVIGVELLYVSKLLATGSTDEQAGERAAADKPAA